MLRANLKWNLVSPLVGSYLVLMLAIGITGCEQSPGTIATSSVATTSKAALATTDGPLSEVNIPASIAKLAPHLEKFQPQVQIISPKPGETLSDDRVTVKLKVTDLPLFKQPELGLGNHLHVILDKQTYQGVYDLTQPLVFKNLAAGTHSLRVFASRPWHESFKNEGAYAQVIFNVFTKTAENNPDSQQPLLTYSRPAGTYSAEPIMLDYYLTNPPTHLESAGSQARLPDWRIRVTVNEQQFILDRWAPVYLQGFKQGKNWVRLELIDDRGNPIPNVYNDTIGIVTYDPQTKDPLATLIRGEIDTNLAQTLVDPNYVAIKPTPIPSVTPTPISTPTPMISPIVPAPIVVTPSPVIKPSPNPVVSKPIVKTLPSPNIEPIQIPSLAPLVEPPKTSIVQPSISPSATSAPIVINPTPATEVERPLEIVKPSPVEISTPKVVERPINSSPQKTAEVQPVLTPKPLPSIVPTPIVTSPVVAKDDAVKPKLAPDLQQPQTPTPATPAPQVDTKEGKNWQTQAMELLKVAKTRTKEFTNTIPAKAQRFGHNLQNWANKALELVEQLRNRG